MKVAVLIYGRLNKAVKRHSNIMSSLSQTVSLNDIDFFCSSDNSDYIEDFITTYNPKDYINDQIIIDEDELNKYMSYPTTRETRVETVLRHFTNKKRVYGIFEEYSEKNNIQYDIIVSLRVDLRIKNFFDFTMPEQNTIYVPYGGDWRRGINDQIAYGNKEVMKKYCNIIENCFGILSKRITKFHPEGLTLANIKINNITVTRFNLRYRIVR